MRLDVETFPGQVPYRAILPQGVDNLLVPVCLSSTHVAWGTIRLEPTWMNLCESAGHAAALAIQNKVTPAQLDPELLLRVKPMAWPRAMAMERTAKALAQLVRMPLKPGLFRSSDRIGRHSPRDHDRMGIP